LTWANRHLAAKNRTVSDFATDFRDGVLLIQLLEILTGQKVGRYNPNPKFPSQKVDNIMTGIRFIERHWSVNLFSVNANGKKDILFNNGLVHIFRYQIMLH
jgi:hypothetical protein